MPSPALHKLQKLTGHHTFQQIHFAIKSKVACVCSGKFCGDYIFFLK